MERETAAVLQEGYGCTMRLFAGRSVLFFNLDEIKISAEPQICVASSQELCDSYRNEGSLRLNSEGDDVKVRAQMAQVPRF